MEARKDGPIPLGEYLIAQRRQDGNIGDLRELVPGANNKFGRFPFESFAIIPETNPPNNPPSGCRRSNPQHLSPPNRASWQSSSYTLAELRAVVVQALSVGTCPNSAGPLNEANFSVDHHNPISRDGDFSIGNILVCHLRCNKIKGNLTSHEFLHLTAFLAHFPPEVGKDVLARLYAGGRFMRRKQSNASVSVVWRCRRAIWQKLQIYV